MLSLQGQPANTVRENSMGEPILSVAVPVQRFRMVLGSLMLTTEAGDIDEIVRAERRIILEVFLVALGIGVLISVIMAGTIVRPIRRLAEAAENVRNRKGGRSTIPDFSKRNDEIGDLSIALADMTAALYDRIDANEHFAADVAHEIKNPLSSISSAVESMPRAKGSGNPRQIAGHSAGRCAPDGPPDQRYFAGLAAGCAAFPRTGGAGGAGQPAGRADRDICRKPVTTCRKFVLRFRRVKTLSCMGGEGRIGQVMRNLLENAASFSPPGGVITVSLTRSGPRGAGHHR